MGSGRRPNLLVPAIDTQHALPEHARFFLAAADAVFYSANNESAARQKDAALTGTPLLALIGALVERLERRA
jgi:hypothetical protein